MKSLGESLPSIPVFKRLGSRLGTPVSMMNFFSSNISMKKPHLSTGLGA
jgi:hypothetical protein